MLSALGAAWNPHSSAPLARLAFKVESSLFPASRRLMETQSLQLGCGSISVAQKHVVKGKDLT